MKILLISIYFCVLFVISSNAQSASQSMIKEKIPTVAFCEMVKNPKTYFDKPIKITAEYLQATEGAYLADSECPLSHDDQIGANLEYADTEEWKTERDKINKISTPEYGSKARIIVVGILKNESRRDFAWYKYRFDIIRVEEVSHIVEDFQDTLEAGKTYRAMVKFDKNFGIAPVKTLQIPIHYAVRIEWTNLKEFPELKKLQKTDAQKQIVFSVVSKDSKQMTVDRWNMTLRCKIIRVE